MKRYDIEKIKLEIDYLVHKHGWGEGQLSLQSPTGSFKDGCGRVHQLPAKETEYTQENLPPGWEISKFIKDNNLYRTRIMKLMPKSCYRWHKDPTKRLHLAIVTDSKCKLVVGDRILHIPADGRPCVVDTTQHHTAFNGSFDDIERIHIVGCMK